MCIRDSPNDTTNEARALLLLEANGVIKLKEDAGLTATVKDIEENPKNVEIQELEAAQVPRVKDEVAFVVLNGNYALEAGFSVAKDAIAYETSDSEAAKTYVNVIAVKEGNEDSDATKALVGVLKSDEIKQYINEMCIRDRDRRFRVAAVGGAVLYCGSCTGLRHVTEHQRELYGRR